MGNREWILKNDVHLPVLLSSQHSLQSFTCSTKSKCATIPTFESLISVEEMKGHTVVFVAINRILVGLISITDKVKPEAALAIAALKHRGIHIGLLTGDNHRTAAAVARQVGISEVYAGVLPVHKAARIRELQKSRLCKQKRRIWSAMFAKFSDENNSNYDAG